MLKSFTAAVVLLVAIGVTHLALSVSAQDDVDPPAIQPATPPAKEPTETQPFKVFFLKFTKATMVRDTLQQLIPDAAVAVDERINAIIVTGPEETMQTVAALLTVLDGQSPAGNKTPKTPDETSAANRQELLKAANELRQRYATQELQAGQFAWRLKDDLDADAESEARSRLSKIVAEAFSLRQQLQELELKLLRERIRGIETQLERRAQLRRAIIKRRVDQLMERSTVKIEQDRSLSMDAGAAASGNAPRLQNQSITVRPATIGAARLKTLRTPEEFRSSAESLHGEIRLWQEQGAPDAEANARQKLRFLLDEYAAQIQILEAEVQGDEAEVQVAKKRYQQLEAAKEARVAATSEVDAAKLQYEKAKVALVQSTTLLDLYRGIGPTLKLADGDVKVETLPDEGVIILRGQRDDVKRVQKVISDIEAAKEADADRKPE